MWDLEVITMVYQGLPRINCIQIVLPDMLFYALCPSVCSLKIQIELASKEEVAHARILHACNSLTFFVLIIIIIIIIIMIIIKL